MRSGFERVIFLLVSALLMAAVDWFAVFSSRRSVEEVAKPLVMVLLAGWVAAEGPTAAGWLVVAGLCSSGIGDLLLLPRLDRFLSGLTAFFVAHVFYVLAFASSTETSPFAVVPFLVGAGIAMGMWIVVGRRIAASARTRDARLGGAVVAYVAVLCTMLTAGFAVGSTLSAAGALVFAMSDAVLGWNRFVAVVPNGRLLTHVQYHLGQGLIAIWAVGLS